MRLSRKRPAERSTRKPDSGSTTSVTWLGNAGRPSVFEGQFSSKRSPNSFRVEVRASVPTAWTDLELRSMTGWRWWPFAELEKDQRSDLPVRRGLAAQQLAPRRLAESPTEDRLTYRTSSSGVDVDEKTDRRHETGVWVRTVVTSAAHQSSPAAIRAATANALDSASLTASGSASKASKRALEASARGWVRLPRNPASAREAKPSCASIRLGGTRFFGMTSYVLPPPDLFDGAEHVGQDGHVLVPKNLRVGFHRLR